VCVKPIRLFLQVFLKIFAASYTLGPSTETVDMSDDKHLASITKLLEAHGQSHLLTFWDEIDSAERENLLKQIESLDFAKIGDWVTHVVKHGPSAPVEADFRPARFFPARPGDAEQERKYAQAVSRGEELISAGKIAAFVVAGGQGTRLGFDGPKGNFPITPVRNKTLFRIFAEYLTAAKRKYGTSCPWYIMTSPSNHTETKEIFSANNFYGLRKEDVFIFEQGTLPNFSFDGKILLADKARIARSPDGHGGCFRALHRSGALRDMKSRGVEFMSYFQVDNPLINILDPLFIGLHARDKAQMSSKAVAKAAPKEKVGNFCQVDGKIEVIEYSDLPDELAEKRNPDGSLAFSMGSIAIHIINRGFAEQLTAQDSPLPLHRAVKKIPHIDLQGNHVEPAEPNGVKLENFVFDALPLASESIILETIREQEFAPVKNATGVDSPKTAKELMVERAAGWLESAGVKVPRKPDGSADCLIEMAPSFALQEQDVKARLHQVPEIKPGARIYLA
jgi:UDP-N-acetylglucosamine/UDP-N-acetylgalactosamine diphosphorylase